METKVFDYESAGHSVELYSYLDEHHIADILDLFDGDPELVRMNGRNILFVRMITSQTNLVVFVDSHYDCDRKTLEEMLTRFFSTQRDVFFQQKEPLWREFSENCIAFRDGRGYAYQIWQYRIRNDRIIE